MVTIAPVPSTAIRAPVESATNIPGSLPAARCCPSIADHGVGLQASHRIAANG